ncbi:5593_t:CDS:2 [Funneliformis mosseae]|uniref:5593_t:CDS:1 n=1 Tax=Funneliformis mosseae TaxID=27381 RepID=A0A9N9C6P8_FUNMO|nr:5593_t:CDS:2 [Funneliformis mosseae]
MSKRPILYISVESSTDTVEIIIMLLLYLAEHLRRHTQQRPFMIFEFTYLLINRKVKDVYVKREVSKDEAVIFMKGKDNKYEIIPLSNTAKLSYRDVLVKGRANETKDLEDFMNRRHRHNENYDDLPDAPQEVLSEAEQENLIFETLREVYKDIKAGEYFEKAFEKLERGF